MTERHVQLPTKSGLTPDEKMVYVSIKRYMNNETKEAFPSLSTIMKHTGYSKPYIIKLTKSLEDKGYIKMKKEFGKNTVYLFTKIENFKVIGYEFLDNPRLDKDEKKTVTCETEFMYLNENNKGAISLTDAQISLATGLDRRLLKRAHDSLEEKGIMQSLDLRVKDKETGLYKVLRLYDLDALGQAVFYTLQNHEDRIESVEGRLDRMEETLIAERAAKDREIALKDQEIARLKFELEQKEKLTKNILL